MASNRAVAYMGPKKLEIQNLDFPKLVDPRGKACHHGVIVKLVTTNICGSDQHIYRGRWGRLDYLGAVVNVEIIPLEKALEAYRVFDDGSPKKFVIDPHGSVRN